LAPVELARAVVAAPWSRHRPLALAQSPAAAMFWPPRPGGVVPPRPGAVALARRSRSLGTAQGRPAGVVAPPPAVSTPPEDVAFTFFPPSLSQLTPGGSGASSLEDLEIWSILSTSM